MVTFQWLQSLGAGCWWPSLSEASVIELGSSYSVLAAPEPSAVKPLTLAQEDRLAEYASEGPPAWLVFSFMSCLRVCMCPHGQRMRSLCPHGRCTWAQALDAAELAAVTQVKGSLLQPRDAPHTYPLPTVFLTAPHLIRRCHDRRTYKRVLGRDGCDWEVLVSGENRDLLRCGHL